MSAPSSSIRAELLTAAPSLAASTLAFLFAVSVPTYPVSNAPARQRRVPGQPRPERP